MRRPPVEYHGIAHRLDDDRLRVIDGWYADRESAYQQAAALTRDYLILTAVITVQDPWALPGTVESFTATGLPANRRGDGG